MEVMVAVQSGTPFGFRFNFVPQSKCTSRDFSEDQPGSRFSWCDNGNFDRKWSSRSNTWGSSTTVCDLPLLSASWSTCDAPRKKEMETKYLGKCWEKQCTGPNVSFQETWNTQGGTFIVSWKRNTRKIRVCFLCFLFPVFRLRPYTHLLPRSKHIAPNPRIARAPELVSFNSVLDDNKNPTETPGCER